MATLSDALRRELDYRSATEGGYTQSDLARDLGVSRQAVHGWLSGQWGVSPRIAYALEAWSGGRLVARDLLDQAPGRAGAG